MTKSSRLIWSVFLASVFAIVAMAAIWLSTVELVDENIILTVRHSAQLAFALYIIVIVARPLQQLLRKPWTARLLRNRRQFGVALAGVMTGHLLLIMFRFGSAPELTYPLSGLLVGGGAYLMFYLLFITSFDGPKKALGPKKWKILHRTGLIWMGVIFGLPRSLEQLSDPDYLKFGIPFVIALTLRFIAWQRSRRPGS